MKEMACIPGEENNRAYLSERTKIQMERSVVPGGCQLELVKCGYMEGSILQAIDVELKVCRRAYF